MILEIDGQNVLTGKQADLERQATALLVKMPDTDIKIHDGRKVIKTLTLPRIKLK